MANDARLELRLPAGMLTAIRRTSPGRVSDFVRAAIRDRLRAAGRCPACGDYLKRQACPDPDCAEGRPIGA